MNLAELVSHLDTELRTAEIADYSNALNGLQLENHHGKVTKIVAAVDATLPVMRKAVAIGADLLIVHPVLGNNAQIAQALGLTPTGGFLEYKGSNVGVTTEHAMSLDELTTRFKTALGGSPVHVCAGGPTTTKIIGISSGGSGSEVATAAKAGIDTFITGEGPHWSYTLAEELGINVLYGGHYATETFGVKALAAHIEAKFGIPWKFVDHPTGL